MDYLTVGQPAFKSWGFARVGFFVFETLVLTIVLSTAWTFIMMARAVVRLSTPLAIESDSESREASSGRMALPGSVADLAAGGGKTAEGSRETAGGNPPGDGAREHPAAGHGVHLDGGLRPDLVRSADGGPPAAVRHAAVAMDALADDRPSAIHPAARRAVLRRRAATVVAYWFFCHRSIQLLIREVKKARLIELDRHLGDKREEIRNPTEGALAFDGEAESEGRRPAARPPTRGWTSSTPSMTRSGPKSGRSRAAVEPGRLVEGVGGVILALASPLLSFLLGGWGESLGKLIGGVLSS